MSPRYVKSKHVTKRWAQWFKRIRHNPKRCAYCGVLMTLIWDDQNAPTAETKEHIVPHCRGGRQIIKVCRRCNEDKQHLTLEEYRAVLQVRYKHTVKFYFEWTLGGSHEFQTNTCRYTQRHQEAALPSACLTEA